MKGYRITRKGWFVFFTIALVVIVVLYMAISAIVGNMNNAGKNAVEGKDIQSSNSVSTDSIPQLVKENAEVVIYFTENSTTIPKQNMPVLDMIVKASKGLSIYKYSIISYSITATEKITEQMLVKQQQITKSRQAAIENYLVGKGVPKEKIRVKETPLVVEDLSASRLDKDKITRKVEVFLLVEK